MGKAISPRGDMPKNRVQVFAQGRSMSDFNPTLPFFLQRRLHTNVRSRAWTIALTFLIGGWLLAANGETAHCRRGRT